MDLADVVAIQQLYVLYGHVMDDRDWPRLGDLFTEDCVFDATAIGVPLMEGLEAIAAMTASSPMAPVAHHVTNVLVESVTGDTASVRAKRSGSTRGGGPSAASTATRSCARRTGGASATASTARASRRVAGPDGRAPRRAAALIGRGRRSRGRSRKASPPARGRTARK